MVKIATRRKRRAVPTKDIVCQMGMALAVVMVMILLVVCIQSLGNMIDEPTAARKPSTKTTGGPVSYRTTLAYGTKDLKERTSALVEQAISTGFRHIVTGGHHRKHNEAGVGIGWKASGIRRQDLYLQTCFVPFSKKHSDFQKQASDPKELPSAIEDQVKLSVETSLSNLQTDYVDAVLFNNFRSELWETVEIHKAWKVLEDFVDRGVIKQLGLTSVHDVDWFETFYNTTRIKPAIVQNRFHSNRGYDVDMQEIFARHNIWVQRFWLLNGSSNSGRNGKDMAETKGVTPAQLMLAFTMSMGSQTCLVGTTSLQHMKDDLEIAKCYPSLFTNDEERSKYAEKLKMKQPSDRPLPGRSGVDFGNDRIAKCQPVPVTDDEASAV